VLHLRRHRQKTPGSNIEALGLSSTALYLSLPKLYPEARYKTATMPSAYKSKGKGRDARQSRSRNTTPSTAGGPTSVPPLPSYLENLDDMTKRINEATDKYNEMLDLVSGPNIPDSKTLETLVEHLNSLSEMANARGDACNQVMREMAQKRKELSDDPELSREVGDRAKLKRETEEDEDPVHKKTKKRKERASKEARPLSHGAHDVARQDGGETKIEGGK
jgi:transcriptional adapter 3